MGTGKPLKRQRKSPQTMQNLKQKRKKKMALLKQNKIIFAADLAAA